LDHEHKQLLLREDHIVETVAKLQRRIGDRFPESGLSTVCGQLLGVAEQASERSDWIGNPIRSIRVAGYASAVMLIVSFLTFVVFEVQVSGGEQTKWVDMVGAIEAGLNVMIFFSLAIWFLISLETRIKRRRAIAAVHELRSLYVQ
jgi:hypothetical protein